MSDNPYFPRLFSALKVGERTLRNRVVLSATLTNYGAGHRVTDRWTNFLVERAKGGSGAIVTEVIGRTRRIQLATSACNEEEEGGRGRSGPGRFAGSARGGAARA